MPASTSGDLVTTTIAAADMLGDSGLDYRVEAITADGSRRFVIESSGYVARRDDEGDD